MRDLFVDFPNPFQPNSSLPHSGIRLFSLHHNLIDPFFLVSMVQFAAMTAAVCASKYVIRIS